MTITALSNTIATTTSDAIAVPVTKLPERVRFSHNGEFHRDLKNRVADYFATTGARRRDLPRMYVKSAIMFTWFVVAWSLLVFWSASWWTALPLAVALGLAVSGIGMGVQHDANHGATSRSGRANRILGWAMDAMGASGHVWRTKHNAAHHTYTNVAGHDDDIDLGVLGRLAPGHPRRPVHRFQHLYIWLLYSFLLPKWAFWDDAISLTSGRVGCHRLPKPTGKQFVALLAGKVFFVSWMVVFPLLFHSVWAVLAGFVVVNATVGLVLATTFQLAHCVEEAEFPLPTGDDGRMVDDWAVHQLATTVDFARSNRALTWFIGGLNFQVVHHLFPKVCHLHYPTLSRIVEETAAAHGVRYRVHRSLPVAIRSHYRLLKRLGRPSPAGAATAA